MDSIRRIVIHDKPPFLDADILGRPLSRLVAGIAGLALVAQAIALVQVFMGAGTRVTVFEHASFAAVSALWLLVGVLVFLQRGGSRPGQLFLLSAATGSTYLAFGTLSGASTVDSLVYAGGLLAFPPLVFGFTRAFPGREFEPWELALYVPAVVLIWPVAWDFEHGGRSLAWRVGLIFVALPLLAAITQAWRDLKRPTDLAHAAQTRTLLFGLMAGTLPGIFLFIVPLTLSGRLSVAIVWQPQLILIFLAAMSYAVLLFEFNEADLILRRGVVYAALTVVILVAYGLLGVALAVGRSTVTTPGGGLSFVAVTVIIGAAFVPIRSTARKLVDWLLYGRVGDRWDVLGALSSRLAGVLSPDALGQTLVGGLIDALHLRGAFLLIREDGEYLVRQQSVRNTAGAAVREIPEGMRIPADSIRNALGDSHHPILLLHARPLTVGGREELPSRYKILAEIDAALTIPLISRSGAEAVVCLRPKVSHDAFDRDDLELLAPVMRQATTALENALLFSRLEHKVEELRHAYLRIAREQEAERARLARELHDGTAQDLATLILLSTAALRQMDRDPNAARNTLDTLKGRAEEAYQGVRRASHALRPLMLDDFGLAPTLKRYVDQFQESTGIAVVFSSGNVETLPDEIELALFRVAQECMENMRKHSGAHEGALSLDQRNGHIVLSISDSGVGMGPGRANGIGLASIRERVEAVGGAVSIDSESGRGVTVRAEIPVGVPA